MSDSVYKIIELTGTSKTTIEDAVNNALEKAAKTVHKMAWFEVVETRGRIDNNHVEQWQVTIRLGFLVED